MRNHGIMLYVIEGLFAQINSLWLREETEFPLWACLRDVEPSPPRYYCLSLTFNCIRLHIGFVSIQLSLYSCGLNFPK